MGNITANIMAILPNIFDDISAHDRYMTYFAQDMTDMVPKITADFNHHPKWCHIEDCVCVRIYVVERVSEAFARYFQQNDIFNITSSLLNNTYPCV